MLGKASLPVHLPHMLPSLCEMVPSPTQCEVGTSPEESTQENQLRPRSCKDLLMASDCCPFMLGHDKLHANFCLQEENCMMKTTEVLEQRDLECTKSNTSDIAGLRWRESFAFSVHISCPHLKYLTLCTLSHCHQFRIKAQLQKFYCDSTSF